MNFVYIKNKKKPFTEKLYPSIFLEKTLMMIIGWHIRSHTCELHTPDGGKVYAPAISDLVFIYVMQNNDWLMQIRITSYDYVV